MKRIRLPEKVIKFLKKQGIVIVSTISGRGNIHCSVKGIVGIEGNGRIFIIDLYRNKTYKNLIKNPKVSITAIDENEFKGYTLQGKARIVLYKEIEDHIVKKWEDKIIRRISDRMISGVQRGVVTKAHHEAELPRKPKYLIEIDIENIIDLAPPLLRKKRSGS